jgi:hypothetical protein
MRKLLIAVIILLLISIGYLFFITTFTFSEGSRAGKLIKFSKKGYMFKTYEGELNLGGVNSVNGGVMINNMWQFSIKDQAVADSLENKEGQEVTLHYQEKLKTLPWVGDTKYIVDKVITKK